jgi:hypothetical protein
MKKEHKPIMPFFVKLCPDRAAYAVKLQRKTFFKMDSLKHLFEAIGRYEFVIWTPHIMVIKNCKGTEVTFSKDGRILIKKVLNKGEAATIAEDVLQIALEASAR